MRLRGPGHGFPDFAVVFGIRGALAQWILAPGISRQVASGAVGGSACERRGGPAGRRDGPPACPAGRVRSKLESGAREARSASSNLVQRGVDQWTNTSMKIAWSLLIFGTCTVTACGPVSLVPSGATM